MDPAQRVAVGSAVEALAAAVAQDDQNKIQQQLYRLSCLALENEQNRRAVVDLRGLAPVVALVAHDNSYVQELALTCLSNLSLDAANKALILAAGALPRLIACCRGSQNTDNRILSCHCLQELAAHSAENARAIADAGALSPLIECTRSGNDALQRAAAKAVWHLLGPDETKSMLARGGAAIAPLVAMARAASSDVQLPAVGCLWELCTCPEIRAQLTAERGAIATLVDLTESADSAVQLFACLAIAFLDSFEPARAVLRQLDALARVDAFVARSADALNTQDVDWDVGHFVHMRALVVGSEPASRRLAVLCLSHLSSTATYLQPMLAAHLLVPLRRAAACGDSRTERFARVALAHLVSRTERGAAFLGALCSLANDSASLLATSRGADVRFVVGNEGQTEEIAAHSLVLSQRSAYFAAMFAVFAAALKYLYAASIDVEQLLSEGPSACAELLLLADKYGLHDLRGTCESILLPLVNDDNVCALCNASDRGNAGALRSYCISYIVRRLEVILATEGFADIYQSNPPLVMEILKKVAPLLHANAQVHSQKGYREEGHD